MAVESIPSASWLDWEDNLQRITGTCLRFAVYLVIAIGLTWLPITATAWPQDSAAENQPSAFKPGEKLTFVLKWTIVPAGEAVLEVLPNEEKAGLEARHFVMTAQSNTFVDNFFKVRDRIDAWSDISMTRSLWYRKKQHEGKTRRDVTVSFDWNEMTAQYKNKDNTLEPIPIADGTFDPLSIFFWFRLKDLSVGTRIQRSITDGKKHVLGIADVVKKEKINVPAGTFDTFLVEPDLANVGGVFEKSPDASIQVWVSADHRRIPIKLKSKVIVGSFSGELVSMTGLSPSPTVSDDEE